MMRRPILAITAALGLAASGCVPGAVSLGPAELAFAETAAASAVTSCVEGRFVPAEVIPELQSRGFVDDGNQFGPDVLKATAPSGRFGMSVVVTDPCRFATSYSAAAAVERGAEAALAGLGFVAADDGATWSRDGATVILSVLTHSSYTSGSSGTQLRISPA